MTICAAWVRKVGDHEELLVASDSRLSGGRSIDHCPKLLVLPRLDCAVCFAGSTDLAYPLMLQLSLAAEAHPPSLKRVLDLRPFVTHAVKVFNSMAGAIRTPVAELKEPDVSFILAGYSWKRKEFEIYTIRYFQWQERFIARREKPHPAGFGLVVFRGDVRKEAEKTFFRLVQTRCPDPRERRIDMEPFEVIRDMLRVAQPHASIGGAPQLAKVTQYLSATSVAVYWPDRSSGVPVLQGRPVLDYEKIDRWILDPDTLWLSHQWLGTGSDPRTGRSSDDGVEPLE
ncbi:MAG TPA: hypothetical protein VF615_28735 [Longimicrobiaceae bacterium]|jgi:hypothetical protein